MDMSSALRNCSAERQAASATLVDIATSQLGRKSWQDVTAEAFDRLERILLR